MVLIDWIAIAIFIVITLIIGFIFTPRASSNIQSYFLADRKLPWYIAGTSMAATTFSADTPLFVTGITRAKGIWANWSWWALAASHMLACFLFSRLWRRCGVLTEVQFVELRYSGKAASILRGMKAILWGVFFNSYVLGGLTLVGCVKIMEVMTGLDKNLAIGGTCFLTLLYTVSSGYWGVVMTDLFQFTVAILGAILLAGFAIAHANFGNVPAANLEYIPPVTGDFWSSSLAFVFSFLFINWWSYKNADGGGILVQRMMSCKDEKNAVMGVLWFSIAHYVIRTWPWIIVALLSLTLVMPDYVKGDHEKAYPAMIMMLLPAGIKGLLLASLLAALMSTVDTHINWGASYIVNDLYKRFLRPSASEKDCMILSRLSSVIVMELAAVVAIYSDSLISAFMTILELTSGIGSVLIMRWLWHRVNAWSEISAMIASLGAFLVTKMTLPPDQRLVSVAIIAFSSLAVWVAVTLLTRPESVERLREFCMKVRPPRLGWKRVADYKSSWGREIVCWVAGTILIFLLNFAILKLIVGDFIIGGSVVLVCILLFIFILKSVAQVRDVS